MLLWIDGFEGYTTLGNNINALYLRRYPVRGGDTTVAAAGRVAGLSAYGQYGAETIITPAITADDTIIVGLAIKMDAPLLNVTLIDLYDGATKGINLRRTSGGELAIYLDAALIETTTTVGMAVGTWYYVELKVVCNGTTGSYDVRVDGHSVMSDTNVDTKAGADDYQDRAKITFSACYLDDIYIADGTGALNNDFIGPCRTLMCSPDGDYSVNWATIFPANGDHCLRVDDGALADDDTTYVEDNTTGNRDLFDYASVTVLTSILGLAINTTCKVTDVNSVDLKIVTESQGTTDVGAATTISSTDYITLSEISETDPSNGVAWDVDYINAARFGFEVG